MGGRFPYKQKCPHRHGGTSWWSQACKRWSVRRKSIYELAKERYAEMMKKRKRKGKTS